MNYLRELKAFRDWLLLNDLPTSAIALWHTLMAINNMTGWKERFTAPNPLVEKLTGLSKQGLVDARKKLLEKGLIEYEKGKKGKAPTYKMVSLVNSLDQLLDQSLDQSAYQSADQSAYQYDTQSLTILKQKLKQKQETNNISTTAAETRDTRANCFETYTVCFGGSMSPLQIEEIRAFMEEGLSEEVICRAFEKAAEVGAKYSYARSILNRWAKKGIRTMADVEREEEEFRKKRKSHNQSGRPVRKEAIPEWFDQWQPVESNDEKIENFEEEKRKLEAELKQFGS